MFRCVERSQAKLDAAKSNVLGADCEANLKVFGFEFCSEQDLVCLTPNIFK
jgi:hypothetical protein